MTRRGWAPPWAQSPRQSTDVNVLTAGLHVSSHGPVVVSRAGHLCPTHMEYEGVGPVLQATGNYDLDTCWHVCGGGWQPFGISLPVRELIGNYSRYSLLCGGVALPDMVASGGRRPFPVQ